MASFKNNKNARTPYSRPADGQWLHDKAPGSAAPAASSQLFVSNLHYEVTPQDLTSIFGQVGTLVREPHLRYDRSGRSSGTAVVSYETAAEAAKAKQQFDGLSAKGQPMEIKYHVIAPRAGKRAASAPATSTLLNRIQKAPLIDRLGIDEPAYKGKSTGPGPVRSRPGRGGRGGAKPVSRGPKKPKTADDLDKELDAFMVDSGTATPTPATTEAPATAAPTAAPAQDVDMS